LCAGLSVKQDLLLAVPLLGALGFWFFSAPDPRFLGAIVVLCFAWSLWLFCKAVVCGGQQGSYRARVQITLNYLAVMGALALFVRWSLAGLVPQPGWGPLPVAETAPEANRSGLQAFVPTNGSQCWNSALPCAVLLHGGLLKVPFTQFGWLLGLQPQRFVLLIER
jgi:hypothetical protein